MPCSFLRNRSRPPSTLTAPTLPLVVPPHEGEASGPGTPITQLPRSSQFFPSRAAVPSGRSFLFAPSHSPPAWAKDGKTCHAPRGSRASSPAGGDPRGGIDPPHSPASGPFCLNEGLSVRRQKVRPAGPGLASFFSPPPGKDWAGPGYPAGSYRPSSSARLKRVRHGPARAMKAAQPFSPSHSSQDLKRSSQRRKIGCRSGVIGDMRPI